MKLDIHSYFPSSDHKLAIYCSVQEDNNKEHCHEFHELVLVRRGHGLHVINSQPYFIKTGDIFFVSNQDYHFYDELGTLSLVNILINPYQDFRFLKNIDQLLTQVEANRFDHYGWMNTSVIEQKLALIEQTWMNSEPLILNDLDIAKQESIFFQLVVSVVNATGIDKNSTDYKLHQLLKYIQFHCFESMNWDALSGAYDIPPRTLYRCLKNMTGMTPEHYVKRLRLISARKYIRETDISITTIALDCGFVSTNHFATAYKSVFHKSPSEERRQLLSDESVL